jgi:low affinity Fe/Cu permease
MKTTKAIRSAFDRFSTRITKATGTPMAFMIALSVIIIWILTGPFFNYSDTWQLIINTGTTIITFLMVFIIQQSQNKDTMALQLKLNELIAAHEGASNRLIDIEDLSEDDLLILKKFYIKLSALAKTEQNIGTTHSIDEANYKHSAKAKKSSRKELKEK